jgi:Ankyrin repeat.
MDDRYFAFPLTYAAINNNAQMVKFLLDNNATVRQAKSRSSFKTPLDFAMENYGKIKKKI